MEEGLVSLSARPVARSLARSAAIERTLHFMQQHFLEPLSLNQLAAIANLSLFQFNTVFRREVGMPPYRYLSHLRIRVAQSLLQTGMPAAMVAAEAGFFDQPHMYRHFKRVCGVTPGQYLAVVSCEMSPAKVAPFAGRTGSATGDFLQED